MSLGNQIYTLRSGLGLSQGALAEKLGVSRQAVSKWENDSAAPELPKLLLLAEVLGVSVDRLVAGEDLPDVQAAPLPAAGLTVPLRPNQSAGLLLIAASLVGLFLCRLNLVQWLGMWGILLGGGLCLFIKRHTAVWCGWALYLTLDMAIISVDWTSWWTIFAPWHGGYGWQRCDMNLWVQFWAAPAAVLATAWYFHRKPLAITERLRRRLAAAAWVATAALLFLVWRGPSAMLHMFGQPWVCMLAAALSLTVARTGQAETLGTRISALRAARRLSQDGLAGKLSVSRQAVSKWETGNAVPELENLLALSRLFGLPLEGLLRGGTAVLPKTTFFSVGQLAGIGLLACGGLELFQWARFFGDAREIGLLCPLLLFLGGALCLFFPKHTGLWCVWSGVLLLDASLRNEALNGEARLLFLHQRIDSQAASAELLFEMILLLLALYAFRQLSLTGRKRLLPVGCWLLWALLEGYIWCWAYPATAPNRINCFVNPDVNFRIFVDILSLISLAAALVLTAAAIRARWAGGAIRRGNFSSSADSP